MDQELISQLTETLGEITHQTCSQQGQLNALMVVLFLLTETLSKKSPALRASLARQIKAFPPQGHSQLPRYREILDFFLESLEGQSTPDPDKAPWLHGVIQGGLSDDEDSN